MAKGSFPLAIVHLLLVALSGCGGCGTDRGTHVDVRGVDVDLRMDRLDQHLFHAHPDSMVTTDRQARARFGSFYRLYVEDVLQGAPLEDPRLPLFLNRFVTDPDWSLVQSAIDSVFPTMDTQEQEFEQAFRRLKALFPDSLVPRIITFNSGYNYGIFPTDSVLGVGLEWFIGSDHPVIGHLAPDAFPNFVKARMRPDMLVPSSVKGWLLVHYMNDVAGADVLTHVVETGKVMVLLEALLPDAPAHARFAFTPEQLAWTGANEFSIWKEVVNRDMLYSRKPDDINRLMNDGPFTSGFPRESPGHIGEWIGYRMVRAYMQANPKVSFQQLFQMDDAREILKHYKPR
jgi:hypothetical protein